MVKRGKVVVRGDNVLITDQVARLTWPQPPPYLRNLCRRLRIDPALIDRLDLDQLDADLSAEYADLEDARCALSPYYWLTTHTKTENKHHERQGVPFKAPLPRKSYLKVLCDYLRDHERLFVPKSREMITSLTVMGYVAHAAQWRRAEVVVQCDSMDKATELVHHAVVNYEEQPAWLRQRYPLATAPTQDTLSYVAGGRVIGLPSGEHKIRMYHPTIYVMDEACFQAEAEGCYNYAHPVAVQIIGISSAGPSWFATQCQEPAL